MGARHEGDHVRVGITDFAQDNLGDVVFVQLPEVGARRSRRAAALGEVESTKSVSEIYAPVAGTVAEVNGVLADSPEALNSDPYGAGWICLLEGVDAAEFAGLLDAEEYRELTVDLVRGPVKSPGTRGPRTATVSGVFCHNCGHRNSPDSNFCSSCGAALTPSTVTTVAFIPDDASGELGDEELALSLPELAEGVGVLVVKRGPDSGAKYLLDQETTRVGRHPESDIFLDDITVSRRHAEFVRADSGYQLCDVGSLNGTYVNRERIDKAALNSGDEVQIGKFKLVFLVSRSI